MYMSDWIETLGGFPKLSKNEILTHAGKISAKTAELKAKKEYMKYKDLHFSVRRNKSIKPLLDSQVVRLDVSSPRVVGLDVFFGFFGGCVVRLYVKKVMIIFKYNSKARDIYGAFGILRR